MDGPVRRRGLRLAGSRWPDEGASVEQARQHAADVAGHGIDDVTTHYADIVRGLSTPHTGNAERGPLLLISGQEDHTVPDVVTRSAFKLYGDSTAVTELKQFADRGHSLTVDSGWRQVADQTLEWLARQGISPSV